MQQVSPAVASPSAEYGAARAGCAPTHHSGGADYAGRSRALRAAGEAGRTAHPDTRQDVRRALPAQQLRQFNADALGSDVRQRMAQVVRCLTGGVINPETVHGREPQRAQNPQRILGEARFGVADGADNARAQILLPVKGVHQPGLRIPCHGVDGEIAPGKVVHHIRDKRHAVRVAMVSDIRHRRGRSSLHRECGRAGRSACRASGRFR